MASFIWSVLLLLLVLLTIGTLAVDASEAGLELPARLATVAEAYGCRSFLSLAAVDTSSNTSSDIPNSEAADEIRATTQSEAPPPPPPPPPPVLSVLQCLFAQWYPQPGSEEYRQAISSDMDPQGAQLGTEGTYGELTSAGGLALLDAVARHFGEGLGPSDVFADLGSGFGRLVLQVYLGTNVGKAVGVEVGARRHQVARSARRAALGVGPTMIAAGYDKNVYAQQLAGMGLETVWTLAGAGSVEAVAVADGVAYAVGSDKQVYKQQVSSMSPDVAWTLLANGPVESIAVRGDVMYAVGLDHRVHNASLSPLPHHTTNRTAWQVCSRDTVFVIALAGDMIYAVGTGGVVWKQALNSMTPTSDWTQASTAKSSVESITVHGGVIYGVSPNLMLFKQDLDAMTIESEWAPTARGSVIAAAVSSHTVPTLDKHEAPNGQALELLHGEMLAECESWQSASVIFVASGCFDDALMLQLGWAMSAKLKPGALIFSQRAFPGCYPRLQRVGRMSLEMNWAPGGSDVNVFMVLPAEAVPQPAWLVPAVVTDAVEDVQVVSDGSQDGAPTALQKNVLQELWTDAKQQLPPTRCAWDALVARARLNVSEPLKHVEALDLEAVVQRLTDLSLTDEAGRGLVWWAAGAVNENEAMQVLVPLLARKARADVSDSSGLSPLARAASIGHVEVSRLLLAHGVQPTIEDGVQRSQPLHYAALHGHAGVARVLVEIGARLDVLDEEGRRPRQVAANSNELLTVLGD